MVSAVGVSRVRLDDPMSVYEVIKKLPGIAAVRDRSKALAMLDAILCPEWDFRYFSFDSRWSQGEEMASMRDGSGNDYAIMFAAAGAYAQACNHESPMTPSHLSPPAPWPGLFDSVPEVFRSYVEEPAFADHNGLARVATRVLPRLMRPRRPVVTARAPVACRGCASASPLVDPLEP